MCTTIDISKHINLDNNPIFSSVLIRSNNLSFENNGLSVDLAKDEKLMIRLYDTSKVILINENKELIEVYNINELNRELHESYRLVNKLYDFKEGSYLVKEANRKSKVLKNMKLNIKQILCNAEEIVVSEEYLNQDLSCMEIHENIPLIIAFLSKDIVKSFIVYRANERLKLDTEVTSIKPLFYQGFSEFSERIEDTRGKIINNYSINKDVILGKLFCDELDKLKEEHNLFNYKVEPTIELIKNRTIILDLVLREGKLLEINKFIEMEVDRPPYHLVLNLNQIALQERVYFNPVLNKEVKEILIHIVAPLGVYTYDITDVKDKGILGDFIE